MLRRASRCGESSCGVESGLFGVVTGEGPRARECRPPVGAPVGHRISTARRAHVQRYTAPTHPQHSMPKPALRALKHLRTQITTTANFIGQRFIGIHQVDFDYLLLITKQLPMIRSYGEPAKLV